MIRLVAFLTFCLAAALAAGWLSAQPGTTVINWLGWRVEMMTSLLVAGVILSLGLLALAGKMITSIISWPFWLGHNWRTRRRRRGDDALGRGMVAFAAGDVVAARKLARRAERLLGSGMLPDLLSAQAAHAAGDEKAAHRYFKSLSSQPDTAYFGHVGVMRLYLTKGETEKGCAAARAALAVNADSAPAHLVLLAEDLACENWKSALDRLGRLLPEKTSLFKASSPHKHPLAFWPADTAHLAVGQLNNPDLLAAHLCLRLSEQQTDEAGQAAYLKKALQWSPLFLEAIVRLAGLEAPTVPRKALKRLESAFKAVPHQRLAGLIMDLTDDNDGQFVARLSGLAEQASDKDEACLIVAEAALSRGIWSSASSALHSVSEKGRSNQYYLLNAELADKRAKSLGQEPDAKIIAAREGALLAAAHAPRARHWQCGGCGTITAYWQMNCPSCMVMGQIDLAARPIIPIAAQNRRAGKSE